MLSPSTKHVLASLTVGESHSPSTSGEGKLFTSTSFYAQKILSTPTFSVFTGKIINSNLKTKIETEIEKQIENEIRERNGRKEEKEARKNCVRTLIMKALGEKHESLGSSIDTISVDMAILHVKC